MKKKFAASIFSVLLASFIFAEEPVADFEIDFSAFKNENPAKAKSISSEKEKCRAAAAAARLGMYDQMNREITNSRMMMVIPMTAVIPVWHL